MPRRLDPKKGMPGLFAPGRPKAKEMQFLVEAPKAGAAVETPPRPAPRPSPAPAKRGAATPVPDYIKLAPPHRAVPVLPEPPAPLALRELPGLIGCAAGWLVAALRTGR